MVWPWPAGADACRRHDAPPLAPPARAKCQAKPPSAACRRLTLRAPGPPRLRRRSWRIACASSWSRSSSSTSPSASPAIASPAPPRCLSSSRASSRSSPRVRRLPSAARRRRANQSLAAAAGSGPDACAAAAAHVAQRHTVARLRRGVPMAPQHGGTTCSHPSRPAAPLWRAPPCLDSAPRPLLTTCRLRLLPRSALHRAPVRHPP